ncbi:MAG: polysaccharide deacetylase family protein [Chloroflexota bacterium]|nr:polysaccharide deacetylase family protein [Chloroflexota bacterium]
MTFGRTIPPATAVPTPSVPAPIPAASAAPTVAVPTATPYPTPDLSGLPYEILAREVVRGSPDIPAVAFTLDGGAIAAYTSEILEILREHEVRITFFITGQFAERHPELVIEMIGDGHEIGNHSYGHPEFTKLSDDSIRAELTRTEEIIKDVAGVSTKPWFRFPYGARTYHAQDVVAREGYHNIYWTIDTIDWRGDATPDLIKQRIRDRLQNGVIILAHLGSRHTVEALPDILTELREQGYQIVKVSELLYPPPQVQPTPTIVVEPTPTVVLSSP